jgi:hypothetical protein
MRRRELLKWAFAGVLGAGIPWMARAMTPDERKRRMQDYKQKALENFPFKLIEVPGEAALAKWQTMRSAGQGYPVVLGADDGTSRFGNLLMPFGPRGPDDPPPPSVEDIVKAAAGISFPADLANRKKAESEAAMRQFKAELAANPDMPLPRVTQMTLDGKTHTQTREETLAQMERAPSDPPLGAWPASPHPSRGLSIAWDGLAGKPVPKV